MPLPLNFSPMVRAQLKWSNSSCVGCCNPGKQTLEIGLEILVSSEKMTFVVNLEVSPLTKSDRKPLPHSQEARVQGSRFAAPTRRKDLI